MIFKKALSGNKLLALTILLVLLSGFGLEVYSKDLEWNFNNIPEKWRFRLEVPNPNSSKETIEIVGYFLAKRVIEKGFDANWEDLGDNRLSSFQKISERYGSGADTLSISINQSSKKSFPFALKKFAFTQGPHQYGWSSHFNIEAANSTFRIATYWDTMGHTHYLRPGVEAYGFISLPNDIDLSKPFTIWYGDYSAELNAEGLDIEQ